jgi:hypothetical protein
MFLNYSKNEYDLKSNNQNVLPGIWAFSALWRPDTGFTAASYLASFFSGFLIAIPEVIFGILALTGETEWYGWYSNSVGYWGSIFIMPLAPMFATAQLMFNRVLGGLDGDGTKEFGSNAVYMISLGYPIWFSSLFMHLVYAPRNACTMAANPPNRDPATATCPLDANSFNSPEDFE